MKKILSVLLCLCMALSAVSAGLVFAHAEGTKITGTDVTWSYDSQTKVLSFGGTGAIPDYDDFLNSIGIVSPKYPWKELGYTTIVFGGNITGIGNYAFCGSSALKTVVIPQNISVIGKGVFYNCKALESAVINASAQNVSEKMFSGCDKLSSVTIQPNAKTIDRSAFYNCSALTEITVPNKVISIGEEAFYQCTSLKKAVISDSVEKIGVRAFYACEALETLQLGRKLMLIDQNAFDDCRALKTVVIPENVKTISAGAFSGCLLLSSVTLPEGLEFIGSKAFNICPELKSVSVSGCVSSIGNMSLGYGKRGAKVDGFTVYGYDGTAAEKYASDNGFAFVSLGDFYSGKCGENAEWKFDKETGELSITGSGAIDNYSAENLPVYSRRFANINKITLSDTITSIGDYAFYGVTPAEFEIPKTVQSIGEKGAGNFDEYDAPLGFRLLVHYNSAGHQYALDNNTQYRFVSPNGTLMDNIKWVFDENDTLYIDGDEFVGGGIIAGEFGLETLPAYSSISGIKNVVAGENIKVIPENAFTFLEPIESITFKSDVEKIDSHGFGYVRVPVLNEQGEATGEWELARNENLKVYGYRNSAVESYAKENGFEFIALNPEFPEITVGSEFTASVDSENLIIYLYNQSVEAAAFIEKLNKSDFTLAEIDSDVIKTESKLELEANGEKQTYTFIVKGDINGDGFVNSSDALNMLNHSVGKTVLEGNKFSAGDINGDSDINSTDALAALRVSVGQVELSSFKK